MAIALVLFARQLRFMLINNRYRVIRELGEGGFGHAYLAEDIQMPSHRWCVLKQLKPLTSSPEVYQVVQERFQREAATLEKLGENHPQIPRLYAYFSEDQKFYLVQEWIEGTTLVALMVDQGPQPESVVCSILMGLLPVLSFIHSQGIIHRDIKPENIILRSRLPTESNQPVLIDFGAVRETMGTVMNSHNSLTSSIVIGTPGYMAAEQAAGRPLPSSDLYSLGLVAIYLLTGLPPQSLRSDPQTGEIIWRDQAGHVSLPLVSVIEQAMRSHPRDRYSSASQMLAALSAISPSSVSSPSSGLSSAIPGAIPAPHPLPFESPSTYQTVVATPSSAMPQGSTYQQLQQSPATHNQQTVAVNSLNANNPLPLLNSAHSADTSAQSLHSQPARTLSPLMIGLLAAVVGAGVIGGGVFISRFAGDAALQPVASESAESAANNGQIKDAATQSERDPSENNSSDERLDEPPAEGEVAIADSAAATPDNPDSPPVDGSYGTLRQDLGVSQIDVYATPDAAERSHYGLPGDRVTILQQTQSNGTLWNLVRFESGAEGWIADSFFEGASSQPPTEPPTELSTEPPAAEAPAAEASSSLPSSATLLGASSTQVPVFASPSLSANDPHYGLGGDSVRILSSAPGDDNLLWYEVQFESGAVGWLRSDSLNVGG